MIVYVFNQYFPDNSGFGRRVMRELDALLTISDVTVICRQREDEVKSESTVRTNHHFKISRYAAKSDVLQRPDGYRPSGMYELKRNIDLTINLISLLSKTIWSNRKTKPEIIAVNSPLTIPFICLVMAKLLGAIPKMVSFHDLEPELAVHMKKISDKNWIVRIEYILERLVTRSYKKVLVTSLAQAEVLSARTGAPLSKIGVIENSTDVYQIISEKERKLSKDYFSLVYMSTLMFDYTITGFNTFLKEIANSKKLLGSLKITVIGDGQGLKTIRRTIVEHNLESIVNCVGHVENPTDYLVLAEAAIIPWEESRMTRTMLPTKLFEYLSMKVPVLAPAFGEFKRILRNERDALLYHDEKDAVRLLLDLMSNKQLSSRLAQNGYKLFKNSYTPDILNKKLLHFYTS